MTTWGESSRSLRVQRDQAFFKKQTLDNAQMRKSAMTAPSPTPSFVFEHRKGAVGPKTGVKFQFDAALQCSHCGHSESPMELSEDITN